MRILTLAVLALAPVGCSPVEAVRDASPAAEDSATVDGAPGDGALDAPAIDAPAGPAPRLHWTFDGTLDNAGSLAGYALTAPAGILYTSGKVGQGAIFAGGQYTMVAGMRTVLATYPKVTIAFWLNEPGNINSVSVLDCNNRSTAPYGGIQLGLSGSRVSMCVSTSSAAFLGSGCLDFSLPSANTWHHWVIRYEGTSLAAGQGGDTTVWIDGALVHTRANDNGNDPVFNLGMLDTLYLGAPTTQLDDVRVYDQVFTPAEQCTLLIGGTYAGTTCTLP